jgi:propanediol dehydratase small subunit
MDKQARIGTIRAEFKDLDEKEAQALYSLDLRIQKKEWELAKIWIDKVLSIDLLREDLRIEIEALQEAIDEEKKEVI